MKKAFFLIFIIFLFALNINAQNNTIPTSRVILPQAWATQPYGVDNINSVVSVGSFDNYIISTTAGFMECAIAVNRLNPLNFVATDNRVITGANYIYYTTNGGVSWSYTNVVTSSGDPVLASDSLGNFYFATLGTGLQIQVQKSTNGGQSWGSNVVVTSSTTNDKEWIACDPTNGTYKNNVYAANFWTGTPQGVNFYRSTNNGATWSSAYAIASSASTNPGPQIVVDYTGRVFCIYLTSSGSVCRISTDGGATFGSNINAASYVEPGTINATSGRYSVKGNIRTNGHPQSCTDLSNGPYRGNVYISYASNPPGPDIANVYCARTTNHGVSWEFPIMVNDDGTTTDQWMTSISCDDQGRVWETWYDSRNDASNILTEIYGAVSTNGGATFSPNFKVSNQNFNPNVIKQYQGTEHYYIGDYNQMSGRTFTFPIYSGQNNSLQDYTAYLPDYGMSFAKASDNLSTNNTSVNYVRIPMMGNYSGTVTYSAIVTPAPSVGTLTITWTPSNVKVLTGTPDSLRINATTSSNCSYGTYTVTVTGAENGGPRTHTRAYTLVVGSTPSGVGNNNTISEGYQLYQNYPNPFNPSTSIEFNLPKEARVTLKVYDLLGREVSTILNGVVQKAGLNSFSFDGSKLSSGIYFYKIFADGFMDMKKMMLMK